MAVAPTEGLAAAVKGRVVDRGDGAYDESRALYNGMIDKHPAAIVYCADAGDVSAAVKFANDRDIRIAVRCGGSRVRFRSRARWLWRLEVWQSDCGGGEAPAGLRADAGETPYT